MKTRSFVLLEYLVAIASAALITLLLTDAAIDFGHVLAAAPWQP